MKTLIVILLFISPAFSQLATGLGSTVGLNPPATVDYKALLLSLSPTIALFDDIAVNNQTAAAAIGDTIKQWTDQSGNSNHFTQTVEAKKPKRTAEGIDFDGGDELVKAPLVIAQPTWYGIIVKYDVVPGGSNSTIFDGVSGRQFFRAASTAYTIYAESATISGGTVGSTRMVMFIQFNGASSVLRVNGTQILAGNPGAASISGINLGSGGGAYYLDGKINAFVVGTGSPNPATVEEYLNKWYQQKTGSTVF